MGKVTDVEVGAVHLNDDMHLSLNTDPASAPKYRRMWSDLHQMQRQGVKVSAFLGGAAKGSYRNLAAHPDTYYPLLKNFLTRYHLDGVDLDIEEPFTLEQTEALISRLRSDFGAGFITTLAPVATDLSGSSHFSGGFSYADLEKQDGDKISWYNTQFYCGWGDLVSTSGYDAIIKKGIPASKVVAGAITNSATCQGYVDPKQLLRTIAELRQKYPGFAGVFGFEYFNAVGGPTWYANAKAATNGT